MKFLRFGTAAFLAFLLSLLLPIQQSSLASIDRKATIHRTLLHIYRAQHKTSESLEEFQYLVKLVPGNAPLQFEFANFLLRTGNRTLAIAHYKKATELDSTNSDYWTGYGNALNAMNDIHGGMAALERADELNGVNRPHYVGDFGVERTNGP
jgi:tetratricopeptide (TPR) repeat protein